MPSIDDEFAPLRPRCPRTRPRSRRARTLSCKHLLGVLPLALPPLLLGVALAQPPLLHEYVPPPNKRADFAWLRHGEKLPAQIKHADHDLPRPPSGKKRAAGEPVLGDRQRIDRQTAIGPDRTTTHDGELSYSAAFNPSVVPFKRLVARDAVGADFKLRIRDTRLRPVRLARRPTPPNREAFWGSVMLSLRANRAVPLPSVAPTAEVVSYRSEPAVKLSFFRDSADNVWVRSAGRTAARLRLVFLTDAPKSYFSPTVPAGVSASQVPKALRPQLPANVRRAARRVLTHIGVRSQSFNRQLERLVAYFRNFRPGRLPESSGNTYLDIALSQRGVCRHRSYAFVITAQALGIPARYISNEAHAFTEVFVPRQGWIRIDLGGASTGLRVNNARAKVVHQPGPDPFPRPSAYAGNYSQLRGNVRGLAPKQIPRRSSRRRSLARFDRSSSERVVLAPAHLSGMARAAARSATDTAAGSAATVSAPPLVPAAPEKRKLPTRVSVYSAATNVLRGHQLSVWGNVRSGTDAAPGLRVELYLSRDGRTAYLLGATVTNALGAFKAHLPIPREIDVGRYRIYAATPGSTAYRAGLSR